MTVLVYNEVWSKCFQNVECASSVPAEGVSVSTGYRRSPPEWRTALPSALPQHSVSRRRSVRSSEQREPRNRRLSGSRYGQNTRSPSL